jgi:hypothetical protein
MLPVVVAGVAISLLLRQTRLFPELPDSGDSVEIGRVKRFLSVLDVALVLGRSEAVAFPVWAALVADLGRGWLSSAIAASAAFLFRVEGGVMKRGAADCRRGFGGGRAGFNKGLLLEPQRHQEKSLGGGRSGERVRSSGTVDYYMFWSGAAFSV